MCSECHDVERRFVFTKQDRGRDGEPMPEQAEPSPAPASTVHEEHVAVQIFDPPDHWPKTSQSNRPKQRRGTDHPEPRP